MEVSPKRKKRGIAFTLDAMLALLVIIAAIPIIALLASRSASTQMSSQYLHLQAEDTVDALSKMQIKYVRNETSIDNLFVRGFLHEEDENDTVLDILGALWASQKPEDLESAVNISRDLIGPLVIPGISWMFKINGSDIIYNSTVLNASEIVTVSRKAASGFARNMSSSGYAARAFLENIVGKSDSDYFFFGGFVGNGNITATIRNIPGNSTFARIYLELNGGNNFTLSINDAFCQEMTDVASGGFNVNNWTITDPNCLGSLVEGAVNNFTLDFSGSNLSNKYIGGGFLRVVFTTDEFLTEPRFKYYFPGTVGAINIYDSFYVIGNITNMTAFLHYKTELQTFISIGNATIYENYANDSVPTYEVSLDSAFILNALQANGLNYSDLNNRTIPLRFGHRESNFTNSTGNVDAFLVTAQSSSMGTCDIRNNSLLSCGASGNVSRFDGALAADKQFTSVILDGSGSHRVGNIGYHNNAPHAASYQDLTPTLATINAAIDKLNPTGESKRCYACAIDEARRRLIPSSSSVPPGALSPTGVGSDYTKVRSIIMMADGNADWCDNKDDLVGKYNQNCGEADAKKQAIDQACAMNQSPYMVGGNNITIYAVGFGSTSDDFTLSSIANCTGGKFFKSSNFSELVTIYDEIAKEIKKTVTYVQQSVIVEGSNSTLYPDSYLNFEYVSSTPPAGYKEISVNSLTDKFPGCAGNFSITKVAYLTDAKLTSYSGDYWTSVTDVNSSSTGTFSNAFNLSQWGTKFISLGDPFYVHLPIDYLKVNETNFVREQLASNVTSNSSICSQNNRVIYTGRLRASTFYSDVYPEISGRNITVYFDSNGDGIQDGFTYVAIGTDLPNFNSTAVNMSDLDPASNALDAAFLELLTQLNYVIVPGNSGLAGEATNPIDIMIGEEIGIDSTTLSIVPNPFGPVDMSIVFWV